MKSRKQDHPRQEDSILMKQRIIHYQSEIVSYENKMKALQQSIEKEKIRNQYLQEKLYSLEEEQVEAYQKEIHSLKEKLLQFEVELEEEKKRSSILQQKVVTTTDKKEEPRELKQIQQSIPSIQAYFAHSILLPDVEDEEKEITVIGDFVIKNSGTEVLRDIIVCLKITPTDAGSLSGKIATKAKRTENPLLPDTSDNQWEFLYDNWKEKIKENGEYWIKYNDPHPLKPDQVITFSTFDIRLPIREYGNSVVVDGFVYSKELPKGVFSLNKIIVNY